MYAVSSVSYFDFESVTMKPMKDHNSNRYITGFTYVIVVHPNNNIKSKPLLHLFHPGFQNI